jgi:chromodomain-helicase-DNA-binding protein 7
VSQDAVRQHGELLLKFAKSELEDENVVADRLGQFRSKVWTGRMRQNMQDTACVRTFVRWMTELETSAIAQVRRWDVAPEWWNSAYDIALLHVINDFGLLFTFQWIVDPERPFAAHIPSHLVDEFRRLADLECSKHQAQRPGDTGGLSFLISEKNRMARALAVVQFVRTSTGRWHHENESDPVAPRAQPPELPTLPLEVTPQFVVWNLGTFTSASSLYPVGYVCRREYFSVVNPTKRCWYEAKTELSPDNGIQFRIHSLDDNSLDYVGQTSSGCWELLIRDLQVKRARLGMATRKSTSVSGPLMFGFSLPQIVEAFRLMSLD